VIKRALHFFDKVNYQKQEVKVKPGKSVRLAMNASTATVMPEHVVYKVNQPIFTIAKAKQVGPDYDWENVRHMFSLEA
jgi:hypothetical protein